MKQGATVPMRLAAERAFAANVSSIIGRWVNSQPACSLMMSRRPMTVPLRNSLQPIRREAGGGEVWLVVNEMICYNLIRVARSRR